MNTAAPRITGPLARRCQPQSSTVAALHRVGLPFSFTSTGGSIARHLSSSLSSSATTTTHDKIWKVYLSGEIHSDWREVIAQGVATKVR